jgi:hypothetical protein
LFISDATMWSSISFAEFAGGELHGLTSNMFAAATARTQHLRQLDLGGVHGITFAGLLAVLRRSPELKQLNIVRCQFNVPDLDAGEFLIDAAEAALLLAALPPPPHTVEVLLDVCPGVRVAIAMLRRQAPYNAFRVRRLRIDLEEAELLDVSELCDAAAASADSLRSLALSDCTAVGRAAAFERLTAAALGLECLELHVCNLTPDALPALTTLLERSTTLRLLHLGNDFAPLVAGPRVPAFCSALRCSRLASLCLSEMALQEEPASAGALLAACTAHPSLRELLLLSNPLPEGLGHGASAAAQRAAGDALAALLDAPGGVLQFLDLSDCALGDAGASPLFAALARSTQLVRLEFRYNDVSARFATHEALPAVLSNTSLRRIELRGAADGLAPPELDDAEDVVRFRTRLLREGVAWDEAVRRSRLEDTSRRAGIAVIDLTEDQEA